MTRPANHAPGGIPDFDRIVHCGHEGHAPTLDSDGECPECTREADAAEAVREALRQRARRRDAAWLRSKSDADLLRTIAREVAAGEPLTPLAALGEYADRQSRSRYDDAVTAPWRVVADACWDRLADEDEREERERAAEEADGRRDLEDR